MLVEVRKLHPGAKLPTYSYEDDAGADLYTDEARWLRCGTKQIFSTGIAIAIPSGYVGLVHPRSGLAYKNGITVLNTPGTIDAGYRGELKVCLYNTEGDIYIRRGDRIAQLVIQEVERASFEVVESFSDLTDRMGDGFGSTGR